MSFGVPNIASYFVDDLTIIQTTLDEYGDLIYAGQTAVKGRILEHKEVFLNDHNQEMTTDAIAWLPKTTSISVDRVIKHGSDFYRVERFIRAKRGKSTAIVFIKCYLERSKAISGVS